MAINAKPEQNLHPYKYAFANRHVLGIEQEELNVIISTLTGSMAAEPQAENMEHSTHLINRATALCNKNEITRAPANNQFVLARRHQAGNLSAAAPAGGIMARIKTRVSTKKEEENINLIDEPRESEGRRSALAA